MKRLLLVRHAKSSWAEHGQADDERPLAARGEHDAPRMGERLRQRGTLPDLLLASPAVRARRTATLMAVALGYSPARVRLEPALYLASPATLLAVIAEQSTTLNCLLLVAHNPGLTDLANEFLPRLALDNLPTGGIVAIDFDTPNWSEIATAPRQLTFYDFPKNPDPVTASR